MELKQLESFAAVVECESFTRAAEKLFISQPTVSAHVRALEEELHSQLIIRTTKSIQVTPRGRELYECACGMLTLRNRLTERWAKQEEQVVHLGASTIPPPIFCRSFCRRIAAVSRRFALTSIKVTARASLTGCSEAALKWEWWDSRDRSHPWNISPFTGIPWCSSPR